MTPDDTTRPQPELEQLLEKIGKNFKVHFEPLRVDEARAEILTIANMQSHLDRLVRTHAIRDPLRDLPLWAKVWPASFVLGRFLRRFPPAGKTLLDIGCGMGICGLVAARYGFARIVLGDIAEDALDFARANVLRNGLENTIEVKWLDVSRKMANFSERFDYVAASEILYLEDLHRPLLGFLARHLRPGGKALFCTDLARLKPHFKKLATRRFAVQDGNVRVRNTDSDGNEEKRVYNILILENR